MCPRETLKALAVLQNAAAEKAAADRQRIKALTLRQPRPLVPIPTTAVREPRGPRLLESKSSLPKTGQVSCSCGSVHLGLCVVDELAL